MRPMHCGWAGTAHFQKGNKCMHIDFLCPPDDEFPAE